jgi:hypothetical protein
MDTDKAFPAGFAVNHKGRTFDYFRATRTGFVSLGSTSGSISAALTSASYSNGSLPSSSVPTVTLFAFWDDLLPRTRPSGNTTGPTPNPQVLGFYDASVVSPQGIPGAYIVEWTDLRPSSGETTVSIRVQAYMYADGTIEYRYGEYFDPLATGPAGISTTEMNYMKGSSATVGAQLYSDNNLRIAVQHSSSSAVLNIPAQGSNAATILRLEKRP